MVDQAQQPSLMQQSTMDTTSTNTLQSDGASSSVKTKKRGPTRGDAIKKSRDMQGGERLSVEFSKQFMQAVGKNFEKFNNECGIICRTACPLNYNDWRKVPDTVKASLRERVLINFDVDLSSETVVEIIDKQMCTSFKNYKSRLHGHFLECNGEEDLEKAKGLKPTDTNISEEVWHALCNYWSSDTFRAMSKRNSVNRGKRQYVSLNGTVSTPNHHLRRGGTLSDPTGEIDTFRVMHFNEKRGWTSDYARTSYENMIEIRRRADMEGSTENSLTDLEIMQQVLGKRPAYIRGWSRVPSIRSDSATSRQSTGSSTRLSYSEMSSRLAATESELASTKSELGQIKNEVSELRQMMRSFASSHSFPDFSSASLNVQAQNLEDGSETEDLGMRF